MKRQFTGGAGGRKGYGGGFGTGGITPVDFLGIVPDQAAMLLLVGDKGDWCIRSDTSTTFIIINTPSSIIGNWKEIAYPARPYKVLADATDPTAGYLDAKVDGATILEDATGHKIGVNKLIGVLPIITIFDNTLALPAPTAGDRYIAKVTANGWTIDNIYEGTGAAWVQTVAADSMFVFNNFQGTFYMYGGGVWSNFLALAPGDHLVKATPGDGAPGELDQKVDNSTIQVNAGLVLEVKALGITDAKVAVANKDGAAGTASMRTLGTGALQACAGNDARLSDARTPTAHALAGAEHSADSITNLNTKLNDGDVISTKASEISALTEKAIPADDDVVLAEDSTMAAYTKAKIKVSKFRFPAYDFYGDQLVSPNNIDWYVNALAPASADSLNNALVVRRFDDTAEEGVGLSFRVPVGATGFTISLYGRAQTAPGAPQGVRPNLYFRRIRNNTAVSAWGGSALAAIAIPANTNFQLSSDSIAFSGLTALDNDVVQLELTRVPSDGSDTLVGDYALLCVRITFY